MLAGADVLLGLSGPGAVTAAAVRTMAPGAIVFAMANPVPEVQPEEVRDDVAIMATGRSDYPNQINNVLAFPGVFKGALDVRARTINEEMKLAAAHAIACVIPRGRAARRLHRPERLQPPRGRGRGRGRRGRGGGQRRRAPRARRRARAGDPARGDPLSCGEQLHADVRCLRPRGVAAAGDIGTRKAQWEEVEETRVDSSPVPGAPRPGSSTSRWRPRLPQETGGGGEVPKRDGSSRKAAEAAQVAALERGPAEHVGQIERLMRQRRESGWRRPLTSRRS